MKWIAVKRSYHGADEVHRPWIVIQEGETRGICECWEEASAVRIAEALNAESDLIELVVDLVNQSCSTNDGELDSMAISTYADAMRFLEDRGMIDVRVDCGRRVIGKFQPLENDSHEKHKDAQIGTIQPATLPTLGTIPHV